MRIAQVAPLHESVPPRLYGGTERVVAYLTDALVRAGHEVTLYASGDSQTLGTLSPVCESSLRLNLKCVDPLAHHVLMLEQVMQHAERFDVIHFHTDYLHFPLMRRQRVPALTTLHGRLDLPDLPPLYREFRDMPVVSVSDAQRAPLPWVNWLGTVHHGLPTDLFSCGDGAGGYLAFLGRISPEKRADLAIEVARQAGLPLKIAAKVDRVDREYFETVIRPLLDDPGVEFVGEIGEKEKGAFLGNALALLFPVDWPEPFGLVMIEAMACGTPIIARRRGSVPEVVEHGLTGFVCETTEEMVEALGNLPMLERRRVREAFARRFSAERMASDYLGLYANVVAAKVGEAEALREPAQAPAPALHQGRPSTGSR